MPHALSDLMKQGMRQWASGVAIVSAKDAQGHLHAMTASSLTSVSDSPPSLLVCINKNARMSSVLENGSARFCVNILAYEHEHLSNLCATPDAYDRGFNEGHWDTSTTAKLLDALAVFECVVDQRVEYGTHFIVIGKIESVAVLASSKAEPNPLCYCSGGYRQLQKL